MISLVARTARFLYSRVAKPVIFRFPADTVHDRMVATGSRIQQSPTLLAVTHRAFGYDDPILSQRILDLLFENPVGLSAGLDKEVQIAKLIEAVGFGFAECGSVTLQPYAGNPRPWYTRLPRSRSILVNAGLKSSGAESVIDHIKATYSAEFLRRFPLNISIAKTNSPAASSDDDAIDDYVGSFRLFEDAGVAKLYTINISCPNTFGGEPFTSPELLDRLLSELDQLHVKKPVFIKLPIDKLWSETRELLLVAARYDFVKGVTIGNLLKDRSSSAIKDPLSPHQKGNISGKPCWEPSNFLLAHAYQEFKDRFVFSGVGGVFTAEDAYTKIKLGASLVELVTGLIYQGPAAIGLINKELAALLRADGYQSVSDAIGIDADAYITQHYEYIKKSTS